MHPTFNAAIEVSHFDKQPLSGATIEWEITDTSKKTLAGGKTTKDLPIDNCIAIANIEIPLLSVKEPSQLTLSVKIDKAGESNQWHIWVYPAKETDSGNKPYFTTDYSDAVAKAKAADGDYSSKPYFKQIKPANKPDAPDLRKAVYQIKANHRKSRIQTAMTLSPTCLRNSGVMCKLQAAALQRNCLRTTTKGRQTSAVCPETCKRTIAACRAQHRHRISS